MTSVRCLALLALLAVPALAQPMRIESIRNDATIGPIVGISAASGDGCSGGLIYDDGFFENGYRFQSADGRIVHRIDVASPGSLKAVCLCWQAVSSGDSAVNFNLLVYDASGAGGVPGNLIASVPATASGIPTGSSGKFYRYDLSSRGIELSANTFIGVQVNGLQEPGIYTCADEGPLPARPGYASVNGGAFWGSLVSVFPLFEALGARAELGASTATCTPSATALCLNHGRFKVEAAYNTGSQSGQATVVKLTDETGYFWFFNQNNVEAVVKVLDACGLNQKFWVFAGGLTNVQTVITVTDTQTGAIRTYTNPQGTPFAPIQDTSALSCP